MIRVVLDDLLKLTSTIESFVSNETKSIDGHIRQAIRRSRI